MKALAISQGFFYRNVTGIDEKDWKDTVSHYDSDTKARSLLHLFGFICLETDAEVAAAFRVLTKKLSQHDKDQIIKLMTGCKQIAKSYPLPDELQGL
jgi:hypothetical protein